MSGKRNKVLTPRIDKKIYVYNQKRLIVSFQISSIIKKTAFVSLLLIWIIPDIYSRLTIMQLSKKNVAVKKYWNGSNKFSKYTKYKMHGWCTLMTATEAATSSRGHSITQKVFIWLYLWYLLLVFARIWKMCWTRLMYQPALVC